jgi:hypothetical protein
MIQKTEIIAVNEIWNDGINFHIRQICGVPGAPTFHVAEPMRLRIVTPEEDGRPFPAAFHLNRTEAQALMDRLWDCGLRPSEGSGSAFSSLWNTFHSRMWIASKRRQRQRGQSGSNGKTFGGFAKNLFQKIENRVTR